jgi:peptidoglycan/xylan/chitin deacetylase (PgdA/CDA1 family)
MQPTFVLSLDEELIWGSFDHTSERDFDRAHPDLRGVVRDLLALFDRYHISATWAVVGHLFLKACARGEDGRAHPELVRPQYEWFSRDWLALDPCANRDSHPLWYGDDLIATIATAKTPQEIACHSFSHLVYGDPGCSRAAAETDLRACVQAAKDVALRSFVFPRNREGHHDLIASHGFVAFRGDAPDWYAPLSGTLKRLAHLADQALALTPPRVLPRAHAPGLWNIPASMLFLHREGVRRFVPLGARVKKAKRGIDQAIATQSLFHLWFHPFNMCADRAGMFAALEEILAYVSESGIAVRTMGALAAELSG